MSQLTIEAYDQYYNMSIPADWWITAWRPTKFAYGSGPYGSGYMVDGHNTTEAQANNAYCIAMYLLAQGWQLEAICGMLGNIQSEGMTQPGYWQSDNVGDMSTGFGLVQWTPASKYILWGLDEWSASDPWAPYYYSGWYECYRIACEARFGLSGQWIPTQAYNITFKNFAQGAGLIGADEMARVEYAASAWLYNYERPADPTGSELQRRTRAREWFQRFTYLFPDYKLRTRLVDKPQKPDAYFKLTDITGEVKKKSKMIFYIRPLWWQVIRQEEK